MADIFDKEKRSKIMSSVRSRNTKPEILVKKSLRGLGFLYQPKIKGNPDFINKKMKIAIFVNGCFWHKCKLCYRPPKTNKAYWSLKISKTVKRDRINTQKLRKVGYKVIVIWEHQIGGKNLVEIKHLFFNIKNRA